MDGVAIDTAKCLCHFHRSSQKPTHAAAAAQRITVPHLFHGTVRDVTGSHQTLWSFVDSSGWTEFERFGIFVLGDRPPVLGLGSDFLLCNTRAHLRKM